MLTKKLFITSWLGSFAFSLLSGLYTRSITDYISIGRNQMQNIYQVRGWPYYFMVTRADGSWAVRQSSYIANAFIWWLGIMTVIIIVRFIQKRRKLQ